MNTLKVAFSLIVAWGFGVMYGIATARAASETAPQPLPAQLPPESMCIPYALMPLDPDAQQRCAAHDGQMVIPITVSRVADEEDRKGISIRPYKCAMPASALQPVPRDESATDGFAK